jgi:hypothetical protein
VKKFCAGFGDDIFSLELVQIRVAFLIKKYRRKRIKHDLSYAISMYIFLRSLSLKIFSKKRFFISLAVGKFPCAICCPERGVLGG